MKKLLSISVIASALLLFVACNKNDDTVVPTQDAKTQAELQKQIDDLKKQLDETKGETEVKTDEVKPGEVKAVDTKVSDEAKKAADEKAVADAKKAAQQKADDDVVAKVNAYKGANYITLKSPKNETNFQEEPIIFTGVVSPNTKKIMVKQSSGDPTCDTNMGMCNYYSEDVYTLQDFNLGNSDFTYRAAVKWNNLRLGTNNYDFTATFWDGSTSTTSVKIYFTPGGAEMGKPVIYLYPQETTQVSVNVVPTNGISVSEPAIGRGWNVIANPSGQLFNLADSKSYPYLFWEGFAANFRTPTEGFVVAKADVKKLFEEKLAILGMNAKETADFEEYWLPKLSEKPYYFITFIPQVEFEKYAPLTVSPKPDSVIRVFFDYKGLDKKTSVVEQKLTRVTRSGFAVVEWGGRLYR